MRVLIGLLCIAAISFAQPFPDVIWDQSGEGNRSHFGSDVFALGDQNEDGFADWAVSSSGEWNQGAENVARFSLFQGGNPPDSEPYMEFVQDDAIHRHWYGIVLGDINGDGFDDWAIMIVYLSNMDSIAFHLYWGGPDGDIEVDFELDGSPPQSWISPLGDFNGDGFDDLYHYYTFDEGDFTEILFGGDPFDAEVDLTIPSEPYGIGSSWPMTFGDINGDGFDDFITAASNENNSFLYLGSADPDTIPDWTWEGTDLYPITLTADVNADGNADIVDGNMETVDVYFGGITPPSSRLHTEFSRLLRR